MSIGKRIKERRKELKIGAEELARRLGKDRSTIYRYEKGDIENLPIDILEPIARALNTTPAYLMGWEGRTDDLAEFHARILKDAQLMDALEDYYKLSRKNQKIVRDLIHNMAKSED